MNYREWKYFSIIFFILIVNCHHYIKWMHFMYITIRMYIDTSQFSKLSRWGPEVVLMLIIIYICSSRCPEKRLKIRAETEKYYFRKVSIYWVNELLFYSTLLNLKSSFQITLWAVAEWSFQHELKSIPKFKMDWLPEGNEFYFFLIYNFFSWLFNSSQVRPKIGTKFKFASKFWLEWNYIRTK